MGVLELWTRSLRGKHRFHRGLSSAGWPGVAFLTSQLRFSAPETLKSLYTCEVKSKGKKSERCSYKVSCRPNTLTSLA